jgi:type III restriction enzyme
LYLVILIALSSLSCNPDGLTDREKVLESQLDFSATPKTQQGRLFPQVIVDYPVAQAIQDGIVKQPILGEIGGLVQIPSNDASVRYRQWIDAGIAKWRDY